MLLFGAPRITDDRVISDNPLSAFMLAFNQGHHLVVLDEEKARFSRLGDASGSVVVLGRDETRTVLTDLPSFGTAVPLATQHGWPETLANLSSSLFSMVDEPHTVHQRLLASALKRVLEQPHRGQLVANATHRFLCAWQEAAWGLLDAMRRAAAWISAAQLLGPSPEAAALAERVQWFFLDRRAYVRGRTTPGSQDVLIRQAIGLDRALRTWVRAPRPGPLVESLREEAASRGVPLSEDQLVAHVNVLLMSSMEPISVTSSWVLLMVSQRPLLRAALHEEASRLWDMNTPVSAKFADAPLIRSVVLETLRVAPPNAIMIRVTRKPVLLGQHLLPSRCEVLLCPFVLHRDQEVFDAPDVFSVQRWEEFCPGPFDYLPFGAGARYCVGRHLALDSLTALLSEIHRERQVLLAGDTWLDWAVDINLMPRPDVAVKLFRPGGGVVGGRLSGPACDLLPLVPVAGDG